MACHFFCLRAGCAVGLAHVPKQGRRAGAARCFTGLYTQEGAAVPHPTPMNEQSRMFHASVPARAGITCLRRHIAAPLVYPFGAAEVSLLPGVSMGL